MNVNTHTPVLWDHSHNTNSFAITSLSSSLTTYLISTLNREDLCANTRHTCIHEVTIYIQLKDQSCDTNGTRFVLRMTAIRGHNSFAESFMEENP
jgi:hypothetical protein